jgi:hypothetical protein
MTTSLKPLISRPTPRSDPPAGPRLRRVPQKLSSLRISTTVQDQQNYRDNDFLQPLQAPRRRLSPSQPYQHLLHLQTSRHAPEPTHHDRRNRFDRSRGPSPTPGLELHQSQVKLEVDDAPSNRSMERIREKVLADFRAGIVGCHYNYEESDVDTEFEGEADPFSVSAHSDTRYDPFDSLQHLGDRYHSESPLESPLTPFPFDTSTSTHDWAIQPAPGWKGHQDVEVDMIPDSPNYDDDFECECCGYQIDDAHTGQSQVVPLIMAGDSGYMSTPDDYPDNTSQEATLFSSKRRMSIYDMLCDPPFKRPRSIDHQNGDDDATFIVAPPSSPVQGAMPFSDLDRTANSSPDRSRVVEEWVMLNRVHTNSPELGDDVIACASSVAFLDELEARQVMMESWDRDLEEDFRREAEEANADE